MKHKYLLHPRSFAIGETEKFYTDMSARGWVLERRGAYLSRFVRTEPQATHQRQRYRYRYRYRIEVAAPDEVSGTLPDEQLAVWADCGWTHVTSRDCLHIFRAPEESEAAEFYLDPAQQAATLRILRRRYLFSFFYLPLYLLVLLLLNLLFAGGYSTPAQTLAHLGAQLYRLWVEGTAFALFCLALTTYITWDSLRGILHLGRLYRRMKHGIPLDHTPKKRLLSPSHIIGALTMLCILVFGFLALAQQLGSDTEAMPDKPDAPFILLRDMGFPGERSVHPQAGRTSEVQYSRSLLTEHWDTFEVVRHHETDVWLYTDTYRLKRTDMADHFAKALMRDSIFAGRHEYTPVSIEGLDAAWTAGLLECVAVRGNLVCYIDHIFASEEEMMTTLHAVADKWNGMDSD